MQEPDQGTGTLGCTLGSCCTRGRNEQPTSNDACFRWKGHPSHEPRSPDSCYTRCVRCPRVSGLGGAVHHRTSPKPAVEFIIIRYKLANYLPFFVTAAVCCVPALAGPGRRARGLSGGRGSSRGYGVRRRCALGPSPTTPRLPQINTQNYYDNKRQLGL